MGERQSRLRLPAQIDQVRLACSFVVNTARAANFGEDSIFQSQLAVEEVFTNIVEHGYQFKGADERIEIVIDFHDEAMLISIYDDAPPFNPLELKAPDPQADLWERQGGGWGVFIVRRYMDEVRYQYENGRNRLILIKQRADESG